MSCYSFNGFIPVVDPSSYIHDTASIIGDVIIGKDCYVGPGAVIRGDWGRIIIEDGCNVQENCVVHMFPGKHITFESGAHIGHGAVVHGATLKANCLIGMNAVVMDGAVVGKNSIVGALSFVKAEEIIPDNHLYAGNPGRIIKEISADMIEWKTEGTALYQSLPASCHSSLLPVSPLTSIEENRPTHEMVYKTWKTRQ
jgi:carbonic anhydrase/acetyltransferase-like protein (isoleucine patch superfamily)